MLQKILNKGKASNVLSPEEQEAAKAKAAENENEDLTLSPTGVEELSEFLDEDELQQLGSSVSSKDQDLQTTLLVSTVYPDDEFESSSYIEVATIRQVNFMQAFFLF